MSLPRVPHEIFSQKNVESDQNDVKIDQSNVESAQDNVENDAPDRVKVVFYIADSDYDDLYDDTNDDKNVENAQDNVENAQDNVENAQDDVENAQDDVESAQDNVDEANRVNYAFFKAVSDYDDLYDNTDDDKNVENAQDNAENAQDNVGSDAADRVNVVFLNADSDYDDLYDDTDDDFEAERIKYIPVFMDVPTQKISWNVENNTVDYDTDAMCHCGKYSCHLKIGTEKPIDCTGFYQDYESDSEEQKKRNKELRDKHENANAERTRKYIALLEKESKEIQEEALQAGPVEKKKRHVPWALLSGTPFHRMTSTQLMESYENLEVLYERTESLSGIQWQQVEQVRTRDDEERRPWSLLDVLMKFAEQTDERLAHYRELLFRVAFIIESRI